jgi:glycerol-3-phosphate cytidylyltransferase
VRVLTIGTFDLLHFGHVAFLQQCASLGSELIVGVNSDSFAASFKRKPVMTQDERMYAVGQLGYRAVLNTSAGRELIEKVQPRVLAEGSDWAQKDWFAQIDVTQDWLDEQRIIVAWVPYVWDFPISTTEIISRVRAAE